MREAVEIQWMMEAAFYTLGCKLNQCESEALASSFKSRGFFITKASEKADIYVVNTCTVTTKAEQKARRMIRKFARENKDAVIFVTGCYAQLNAEILSGLAENVFVVPLVLKHTIMDLPGFILEKTLSGMSLTEAARYFIDGRTQIIHEEDRFKFIGSTHTVHTRAYLKIQDGCNNNCAYCRVRIARGKSVSLRLDEVVKRALDLEAEGYREIVLTGVNISDYLDPDHPEKRLPALIRSLTCSLKTAGIRLSSLEPDMIDEDLAEAVMHPSVAPHFHIPVQSGSDTVLEKIHRHYKADRVRNAVELLKGAKDDPFIAADIIVGLPYEADDEFEASCSLLQDCGFSQIHIFPYSPRPGTELYTVPLHVPERVTKERAGRMHDLASSLYRTYVKRWMGREVSVILEKESSTTAPVFWTGLSGNYLHMRVHGVPGASGARGRAVRAVITAVDSGIEADFIKFV